MSKKVLTSNESIKKSEALIIYCTKTRRIKLTPLYVHHNTKDDEQYNKLELLEKDYSGNFNVVSSGNWNIYSDKIENLYDFIQTTTELQSKDLDTIIISKKTSQKSKILTQYELSKQIGISTACINRWEKNLRIPNIDSIIILCKFFNRSADYLIGLED